ncbi:MAG TPA: IS1595 family transposase [Burkholderiales bacterium]|nr:IS1595 family transposase [Burkholderiales bacterium]
MEKPETISLYEFFQKFPNEESARLYFEGRRWENGKYCPHCGSFEVVEVKDHKPMPYRCKDCRKHFSVRTASVLEESRLPLQKWLMAMYMMTTARKGIPSTQMAKELGITQKSAWFLAQRIREAFMANVPAAGGGEKIGGNLEVDETYIGGKETNRHANKKLRKGRGSVGKSIVVGLKQRNGVVVAEVAPNISKKTLHAFVLRHADSGASIYTDSLYSYHGLEAHYYHRMVNHAVGEYVKHQAHTNGIESFWALLKRGYYGVYHYMSAKHLHRYVGEFSYRHNTATIGTLQFIDQTIANSANRRLTYKELTNAA